jgi:hypothetical protein
MADFSRKTRAIMELNPLYFQIEDLEGRADALRRYL